jgi:hypothetical protein
MIGKVNFPLRAAVDVYRYISFVDYRFALSIAVSPAMRIEERSPTT